MNVTFQGEETKSAHINGTYGDIRVYTFIQVDHDTCRSRPQQSGSYKEISSYPGGIRLLTC